MGSDAKYDVSTGDFVNRRSGLAIPDDEPVFILRARDRHAYRAIVDYAMNCDDEPHRIDVLNVARRFKQFALEHPEKMKEPGT